MNTSKVHNETDKCGICQDDMQKYSAVNSLGVICCDDNQWYHKICLKKAAFAFGNEFDCPSCGNKKEFQANMQMNGIYIPDSHYLPHYDSHTNIEIYEEETVESTKRRRVHKNWILVKTYPNKKAAEQAIQSDECWSFYYSNDSSAGVRINYRCNAMKFRGKQCDAALYILCDSRNESVHLYRTELDHSHDSEDCQNNAVNKIPAETEKLIRNLFEQHVKPKAMLYNLVLNGHKPPTKSRLTTFLAKLRKEKYGKETLNYGTLQKWLIECSDTPENDTDPFIVNHVISIDDKNEENSEFRFFVSSKRLLQIAMNAVKLHTDGTYKLIWQGFPVLLIGTTDANRKFHPIGLCVSKHERTIDFEFIFRTVKDALLNIFSFEIDPHVLIADAASSIKNGFTNVFGTSLKNVMCWAHVRRNIVKHLPKYIKCKKKQTEFLMDLDKLQLSRSSEEFEQASNLFVEKWELVSEELVQYFTQEWLVQNRNWYEGYSKNTPSTNNALESYNRLIKDEQTLRERFDLSHFRVVIFAMITQWSKEYDENLNSINNGHPDIGLKWWTAGYQFARSNTKIAQAKRGNKTIFTIHTTENENCEEREWENFSDFKRSLETVHTTFKHPISADNWRDGDCDCGNFFKNFLCEHLIGVALRLKVVNAPIEAKTVPIGQKRKRGRPAKSKPALQLQ